MSSQGFLFRFVNDAHAAVANLAENAVLAEAFQPRALGGEGRLKRPRNVSAQRSPVVPQQGRKALPDGIGKVGKALDILEQGRLLAATMALDKLSGEALQHLIGRR